MADNETLPKGLSPTALADATATMARMLDVGERDPERLARAVLMVALPARKRKETGA